MKQKHLRFGKGFRIAITGKRAQAATMVLAPGDHEGGSQNYHRGSDQWLYVVAGEGKAIVNGKPHSLRAGNLLLIEHGDKHEIRATGSEKLETLNFYTPPAYESEEEPLPSGEPGG